MTLANDPGARAGQCTLPLVRTALRTCPLCEATCGLEITLDGEDVVSIRGDRDDVLSHGFICPKGYALKELHADPDRVRTPLIRRRSAATWDEAFAFIDERLTPILAADRNAVAVYLGNPNAHNLSNLLYDKVLLRALGTRNSYSASTVDQYPKQMACALMFGTGTTVPVPDLDRTEHLLILGANPLASNGSLMTAPDARGRLRGIRARGGKLVVIDPRRTRTAEEADEHHFIRPGTDALLLFALVHVLFEERLVSVPARLAAGHRRPGRRPGARRAVHPRGGRQRPAGSRRDDPAHRPRARHGRSRRCVRADRHLHPGVRRAGQLAGRRAEPADRQSRPRGRRDVPARRGRPLQRRGAAGPRPGRPVRPLAQPRPRAAGDLRRASGGLPGRGDRHPGRGPDPRADHDRRQPRRLDSEQRAARPGAWRSSSSWSAWTST